MAAGKKLDMIGITPAEARSVVNLIDLATQRGAFRGNELSQVGQIYNKFRDLAANDQGTA